MALYKKNTSQTVIKMKQNNNFITTMSCGGSHLGFPITHKNRKFIKEQTRNISVKFISKGSVVAWKLRKII
jgi:hypothetical protein